MKDIPLKVELSIKPSLKDSELRYRRLFETAKDGILILDAKSGEITDVNPFLKKLLGYSKTEFLGKQLWEFGFFKDIAANKSAFRQLQKDRYIRYKNLPLQTRDGEKIFVEFVSNVYGVNGKQVVQCNIRDITEHKRMEHELHETNERFLNILDNIEDGYYEVDLKGSLTFVNPSYVKMLGYDENELIGMDYHQYMSQETAKVVFQTFNRVYRTGIPELAFDWEWIRKDGKHRSIEISISTIKSADESIVGFHGIVRDVTQRKRAEEALRESENRFRALIVNNADAITLLDANGIAVYDSPAAPGMLGYASEDWIGRDVFALIHPDDLPKNRDLFKNLTATPGARVNSIFRLRHKSGSWSWVEMVATNLLTEPGVNAIVLNYRDITERKRAEEALRESEEHFRALVENASDLIAVLNSDGTLRYASPAVKRILGYTVAEAIGKSIYEFVHPEDVQNAMQAVAYRLENPDVSAETMEIRARHADGTWRIMEGRGDNLLTHQGVTGIVLNFHDITERKRAEEALHQSENKFRSLFAAMTDIIIVYDSEGRYLEIAPTDPSNLYLPPLDMLGKTVTELFPAEQADLFLKTIRKVLNTNQITNVEYSLPIGNKVAWFSAAVSSLSPDSVIWVAHDIIERKRAEEKIEQQLQRISALRKIDLAIASSFDLKIALNTIVEGLISQLHVDAAAVLLLKRDLNDLEFVAGRGFINDITKRPHLQLGEGYAGKATLERRMVHIPNLKDAKEPFAKTEVPPEDGFVSLYAMPILVKGKVRGVLEVFHRSPLQADAEWLSFLEALGGQAAIAIDNGELFGDLQRSNIDLRLAYDATIEGWSRALDLRDKETEGHTQRVTKMTLKLAEAVGIHDDELVQIRWGGLLHDIGKMGVPDHILLKPGPLTDEEWVLMRKHPAFAYEMLLPIHYLKSALDIPYCHHEKWDGTGYPRGLKGEQIPLSARIFAVVDIWDALRSDRPYRPAWTKEKALEHIKSLSGSHLDPKVADAFLKMISEDKAQ